jgi:hypothetical protein
VRGGEELYGETRPSGTLERVVDPEFHMAAAQRDYEAGIYGSAADEIRKVAVFMGYEAERSAGERRDEIEDVQRELEQLARDASTGDVEVARLDEVFSQARAALRR